jgi:outer membrane protein assembly factor BamA
LIHDTTTYANFEPLAGHRFNLSAAVSDKVLGSNRNFVVYQGEFQLFQPLGFVSRDTVWSTRLFALDQTGDDRHLFYFGAGQVRGLSYGEFLCEKMAVANIELRRPYLQEINRSLWPLDFLLIKDAHLALFYDVGVATNNWPDLGPNDVRGSYGVGLRLHTFILEKALVSWSFDIAQRLDRYANTAFYLTLGSMF